ncbi:MAG: hypothetical protein FWE32_10830 [Oscillospiraceae bacterium]|nr:hypothetical protein [Oscillospiraceae bacterium]
MRGGDPARKIGRAIAKIGGQVLLIEGGDELPFTASIQPIRRQESERAGPWGIDRRRRAAIYASWCEISAKIKEGSCLRCQEASYRVVGVEVLKAAGRPLYIWGLLEREGDDLPWS